MNNPEAGTLYYKMLLNSHNVELRAIKKTDSGRSVIRSSHHDSVKSLRQGVSNTTDGFDLYTTINPYEGVQGAKSIKDANVLARKVIFFDIDPVRPTGTASSSEQRLLAHDKAMQVTEYLSAEGWAEPSIMDSGNGTHLIYWCDLDRDYSMIGLYGHLADKFNTKDVEFDVSVKNLSRVCRLYGTYNVKAGRKSSVLSFSPDLTPAGVIKRLSATPELPPTESQFAGLANTLHTEYDKTELSVVEGIVQSIPHDKYQDWINVGMALKGEYGELGFDCWLNWSLTYPECTADNCRQHWDSFKGGAIGMGTLFTIAGVTPSQVGKGGDVVKAKAMVSENRSDKAIGLANMNEVWGQAKIGGAVWYLTRVRDSDGNVTTHYSKQSDFMQITAHLKYVVIKDGKKTLKALSRAWLEWADRRVYSDVEFLPVRDMTATTDLPDNRIYNTYCGVAYAPTGGDHQPLLNHIQNVWCNGDDKAYQYIIGWLANMVQKPERQGGSALVLTSTQGAGKNIITDIFDRYFGDHGLTLMSPDDVSGFNDHVGRAVLLVLNEATWGGNKKTEGILKGLITDDKIQINAKYKPLLTVRNRCHLMVLSNEAFPVAIGRRDRRYMVLGLSDEFVGDKDYFDGLIQCRDGGGGSALVRYLLDVDNSTFDVRDIPVSEQSIDDKVDIMLPSLDSHERWWFDCLADGLMEVPGNPPVELTDDTHIDSAIVYDSYIMHSDRAKVRYPVGNRVVGRMFKQVSPSAVRKRYRKPASTIGGDEGDRGYMRKLKGLAVLRSEFDKYVGLDINWDGDLEDDIELTDDQISEKIPF